MLQINKQTLKSKVRLYCAEQETTEIKMVYEQKCEIWNYKGMNFDFNPYFKVYQILILKQKMI
jgi:hypothetical protein